METGMGDLLLILNAKHHTRRLHHLVVPDSQTNVPRPSDHQSDLEITWSDPCAPSASVRAQH